MWSSFKLVTVLNTSGLSELNQQFRLEVNLGLWYLQLEKKKEKKKTVQHKMCKAGYE